MPDISGTIRTITLANEGVSSVVGSRMHSDVLPEKIAMPAIRYLVVDTLPNECLGGIAPISRARLQLDCYAKSRSASVSLANAVRLALEKKHRGDNTGEFIHEISLQEGGRHMFDLPPNGSDQRRYITILEFFVFYTTTTA